MRVDSLTRERYGLVPTRNDPPPRIVGRITRELVGVADLVWTRVRPHRCDARPWVVGVLAAALVGCSDPAPPEPSPANSDPGSLTITASLTQYRVDEALHRVQVKLRQAADAPAVQLREVAVRLPGFEDGPVRALESSTRPGGALDLPVVYGAARCHDEPPQGDATAILLLDVAGQVEVTLDDPFGLVGRLWQRECDVLRRARRGDGRAR